MPTKTKLKSQLRREASHAKSMHSAPKGAKPEIKEDTKEPEISKPLPLVKPARMPEVPHIDLPGDEVPAVQPAWHTNEDLPSFAKSANVPSPIPPSKVLTSEPPLPVSETVQQEETPAATSPVVSSPLRQEPVAKDLPLSESASGLAETQGTLPFLLGGIVFGIIVLLAIVTVFFSFKQDSTLTEDKQNKVTPIVAGEPTVTPGPKYDKGKVTIEVLNGSGVKGAAANASKKLEKEGFVVMGVGNAKSVENTQLFLSENVRVFEEKILADIQKHFASATVSGTLAATDTSASAQLVLGKN